MNKQAAEKQLKKTLTPQRYNHTLGVIKAALQLAEHFHISKENAYWAALLHDCAKNIGKQETKDLLQQHHIQLDAITDANKALIHAVTGALMAEDIYGIQNADILNAIRYHTTGRAKMSPLEKIIFISDMIEEGRKFPGVENIRNTLTNNLNQGVLEGLAQSISFVLSKKQLLHPDSVAAWNDLIQQI